MKDGRREVVEVELPLDDPGTRNVLDKELEVFPLVLPTVQWRINNV